MEEKRKRKPGRPKGSKKIGRPSSISATVIESIAYGVEHNLGKLDICAQLGMSDTTWDDWHRRGEHESKKKDPDKKSLFLAFYHAIRKAKVNKELKNLEIIKNAAKGGDEQTKIKQVSKLINKGTKDAPNWQMEVTEKIVEKKKSKPSWTAAAWLLERTIPEKYALKRDNQVQDAEETAKQIQDFLEKANETEREASKMGNNFTFDEYGSIKKEVWDNIQKAIAILQKNQVAQISDVSDIRKAIAHMQDSVDIWQELALSKGFDLNKGDLMFLPQNLEGAGLLTHKQVKFSRYVENIVFCRKSLLEYYDQRDFEREYQDHFHRENIEVYE